jgi:hypothetical protein
MLAATFKVASSALADSTMAALSPERKTRHIPFPGQLLLSLQQSSAMK